MNTIKNTLLVILTIGSIILTLFLLKKNDPEIIKVPVVINYPLPVVIGESDTIFLPQPIKESKVNQELLQAYNKLKDSTEKLNLYIDAITEREYNLSYKDSFQTVDVYTKTQGKVLSQAIKYETNKDYVVKVDTILDVPIKNKIKVWVGLEGGTSFKTPGQGQSLIQPGVLIKNKKDNIISFKADRDNFYAGYYIKL